LGIIQALANLTELLMWFFRTMQDPQFDPCCNLTLIQFQHLVSEVQAVAGAISVDLVAVVNQVSQHVNQLVQVFQHGGDLNIVLPGLTAIAHAIASLSLTVNVAPGTHLNVEVTLPPDTKEDLSCICKALNRIADALEVKATADPKYHALTTRLFNRYTQSWTWDGEIEAALATFIQESS